MNNQEEICFIRLGEVTKMVAVSESTIYDWIKKGMFPRQIKLGRSRVSAWLKSEVIAWMRSSIVARGCVSPPNQPHYSVY